jgi:hypothetical protein
MSDTTNQKTEIIVVCMYCINEISRKEGHGTSGFSHGICMKCEQKALSRLREDIENE